MTLHTRIRKHRSAKSAYDALSEQQKELIGAQTLQKLNALVDAVSNMTPSVIFGDINADTKIDTQDALMALQYSVDLIELTDEQKTAADVDANQKIDPSDALMILQATVDLIQPEDFPAVK